VKAFKTVGAGLLVGVLGVGVVIGWFAALANGIVVPDDR
jgi:hypothetical protein